VVPTLAVAGIDKHLPDRARKYAAIPEEKFEGLLAELRGSIGAEDARVTCDYGVCRHSALISFAAIGVDDGAEFPSIAKRRFVCSRCGGRAVHLDTDEIVIEEVKRDRVGVVFHRRETLEVRWN
jgi:hypothetical protein